MKYRKKPVVIDAMRFSGRNFKAIFEWVGQWHQLDNGPGMWQVVDHGGRKLPQLEIETLEGNHIAGKGDWILRGIKGEFYPCKHDIFVETYEDVAQKKEEAPETIDNTTKVS